MPLQKSIELGHSIERSIELGHHLNPWGEGEGTGKLTEGWVESGLCGRDWFGWVTPIKCFCRLRGRGVLVGQPGGAPLGPVGREGCTGHSCHKGKFVNLFGAGTLVDTEAL